MQFTARLLAVSAVISQALGLVILTNTNWDIREGQPFTITWSDADGPVSLLLKNGPSSDLGTVSTIASGQTGNSFTWTPTGIPSNSYAIEINDSSDVNYSTQFAYIGTTAATTSGTSTTASSTTTDESTTTTSSASMTTLNTASATATGTSSSSSSRASTATKSGTSTTAASTATNTPLNTNASAKMGSPLALVLLTVAALMLCN